MSNTCKSFRTVSGTLQVLASATATAAATVTAAAAATVTAAALLDFSPQQAIPQAKFRGV